MSDRNLQLMRRTLGQRSRRMAEYQTHEDNECPTVGKDKLLARLVRHHGTGAALTKSLRADGSGSPD